MSDKNLILVTILAELIAVNEYLRERGNKQVCTVLDDIVEDFRIVLCNSKQK